MVGGLVRLVFDRLKMNEEEKNEIINDGILYCSGMIAGEGLVGILLAVLAIIPIGSVSLATVIDISGFINLPELATNFLSLFVFALIVISLLKFSIFKKRNKK